jgi:hypothetical protein
MCQALITTIACIYTVVATDPAGEAERVSITSRISYQQGGRQEIENEAFNKRAGVRFGKKIKQKEKNSKIKISLVDRTFSSSCHRRVKVG